MQLLPDFFAMQGCLGAIFGKVKPFVIQNSMTNIAPPRSLATLSDHE